MTSLALAKARHRPSAVILHLTGQGYLGHSRSPLAYVLRPLARAALRRCTSSHNAWLVAENSDDAAKMIADRVAVPGRTAIVPGAGVDAGALSARSLRRSIRRASGRLCRTHAEVEGPPRARGCASPAAGTRRRYRSCALRRSRRRQPRSHPGRRRWDWSREAGIAWHGRTNDIAGVWRAADIAVVPALGGDGMPRAMLEAAACGRPLVVSDVPGCRAIRAAGRGGVSSFRPAMPARLRRRLPRLAGDLRLRLRMGAAARRRVLHDYTEDAVRAKIRDIYRAARWAAHNPVSEDASLRLA